MMIPIHILVVLVLVLNLGLNGVLRWWWRHIQLGHNLMLILHNDPALTISSVVLLVDVDIHTKNLFQGTLDP